MIVTALIALCGLVGLSFLIKAARLLRRKRLVGGAVSGASGLILVLAAACAGLLGFHLLSYQRLTHEQPAVELQFTRTGERRFDALLTYPDGKSQGYELFGDEWQVDGRVLKWHALVNVIGFDSAYRLERISGRYNRIEDERSARRSVYALNPPARIDVWELARRYKQWVPWVDAFYGSATYLPMTDGALYEVKVTQSGLTARPLNDAARQAVGNWR